MAQARTKPIRYTRPDSGFTLIEVLVGIMLLSLIMVALFSALHMATSAWRKAAIPFEAGLARHSVTDLVRRQFRQLHAVYRIPEAGAPPEIAFFGEDRDVRFIAPLPAHRGVAGLYVNRFRIDPDGRLHYGYELYRPDRNISLANDQLAIDEVLLEGFAGYRFRYAVMDEAGIYQWLDEWTDPTSYPVAVSLYADDSEALPGWDFAVASADSRFRVQVEGRSVGMGGSRFSDVGVSGFSQGGTGMVGGAGAASGGAASGGGRGRRGGATAAGGATGGISTASQGSSGQGSSGQGSGAQGSTSGTGGFAGTSGDGAVGSSANGGSLSGFEETSDASFSSGGGSAAGGGTSGGSSGSTGEVTFQAPEDNPLAPKPLGPVLPPPVFDPNADPTSRPWENPLPQGQRGDPNCGVTLQC